MNSTRTTQTTPQLCYFVHPPRAELLQNRGTTTLGSPSPHLSLLVLAQRHPIHSAALVQGSTSHSTNTGRKVAAKGYECSSITNSLKIPPDIHPPRLSHHLLSSATYAGALKVPRSGSSKPGSAGTSHLADPLNGIAAPQQPAFCSPRSSGCPSLLSALQQQTL